MKGASGRPKCSRQYFIFAGYAANLWTLLRAKRMNTEKPCTRLAILRELHSKTVLAKAQDLAGASLNLRVPPSLGMGLDGVSR